jgi:hypothetical protein
MELQIGQVITAPFLPAPAEVKKFERRGGYCRLEILLQDGSNQYFSRNITDEQLAVSTSQVDPLPHQTEAVYRYVLESPGFIVPEEKWRREVSL